MKIPVKHDMFPENEVIINAVWCDIGGHKANENNMAWGAWDASVCYDCYDHYTDKWRE